MPVSMRLSTQALRGAPRLRGDTSAWGSRWTDAAPPCEGQRWAGGQLPSPETLPRRRRTPQGLAGTEIQRL
eukprot:9496177-Pyramimonas_sp.AAC.1